MSEGGRQRKPESKRPRKKREPLKMHMTVVVRTGERPEDQLTLMNNRELYMLGNVFEYRGRIVRYFVTGLLRVATSSPRVYREIAPSLSAILNTVRPGRRRNSSKR